MVREILKPNADYIHISIPKEYVNKNIEVLIFDLDEANEKKEPSNELFTKWQKASKNVSKIDKSIDILKLDEEMNGDIF